MKRTKSVTTCQIAPIPVLLISRVHAEVKDNRGVNKNTRKGKPEAIILPGYGHNNSDSNPGTKSNNIGTMVH